MPRRDESIEVRELVKIISARMRNNAQWITSPMSLSRPDTRALARWIVQTVQERMHVCNDVTLVINLVEQLIRKVIQAQNSNGNASM